MKFHHVAMAVGNIEEACAALCNEASVTALGDVLLDLEQGAHLRLLDIGGLMMELVQDDGDGPVAAWLKRGCKLYHVCYEVDDLEHALEEARHRGCAVVSPPKPAVLFDGCRVAFVMDRVMGLVEFLEKG